MTTTSFWEHDVYYKPYDLVIIGAGITGCSAALEIRKKQPDWRILMLERNFYPSGASSRNAGFACFGSISELLDDLEHTDEGDIKELVRKRYEGLLLLRDTVPAEVMDFEMCGGHELFTDKTHFDTCANAVKRFNGWMKEIAGVDDVYSTSEVNGHSVIYNKYEGYLHSGKLMQWLHTQVQNAGIEIRWGSKVRSVKSASVTLDNGFHLDTKKILLATNGFTGGIVDESPIVPARGYVFVTNELDDMPWRGTWHYDKGYIYFRNIGNRLLLGGARNIDKSKEETSEDKINPLIKAHLIQFLMNTLKLKGNWAIEHEWTGVMGFGPGKTPLLKEIESDVWVGAGLSGMGVALGMQFGKDIANKI